MSEISRLGRESIETAYALKQLATAGVRSFSYLEDREVLIESLWRDMSSRVSAAGLIRSQNTAEGFRLPLSHW